MYLVLENNMLNLVDPMDRSVLHSQPIASIRVWGVGRDNGRLVIMLDMCFLFGAGGLWLMLFCSYLWFIVSVYGVMFFRIHSTSPPNICAANLFWIIPLHFDLFFVSLLLFTYFIDHEENCPFCLSHTASVKGHSNNWGCVVTGRRRVNDWWSDASKRLI